jgi:hypothetical protein
MFRGIVRDAATARPLIGALVTLDVAEFARTTRTDETGAFTFINVRPGEHLLSVKWLGYDEVRRSIDVQEGTRPVVISLARFQALDTVRIRAANQAIYGVVAGADMRPIQGASVHIVGMSKRTVTDSNGRFFTEIRVPGPYVVRASAGRHQPQTVSVTVPPRSGVEVALLLDSMSGNAYAMDHAFAEFNERLQKRMKASALVTRAELLRDSTATTLFRATHSAPSFVSAALRFGDTVCVFVDGRPRPNASIHLFDAQDVEAVEYYTKRSEGSGTLAMAWPYRVPCTATGQYNTAGRKSTRITPSRSRENRLTNDLIFWVVIWLKH